MNTEQFLKHMKIICRRYKELEELYDSVQKFTGANPDRLIEKTSVDPMIDMLEEWVGDVNGWIRWFVYEKECGEKPLSVFGEDGAVVPSETLEDIWNLIKMERKDENE